MKRTILWFVSWLLVCIACDDSSSDTPKDTDANGGDTESESEPVIERVSTEEMLERSLVSMGNNVRTKALIEKARSGEEVTLAYIGGSITEGYTKTAESSYVVGSYDLFKTRFAPGDGANVHFVNAGMGGTPSTLGMIRYKRDVLDPAETPPDLVVVEFAVNDGDDPTNGASYESLVRTILESENKPAVILLFSVFKSRWNLEDRLRPVGEHYDLPMISIKEAVVPELDEGTITDEAFFRDDYHPTSYGFRIMSETIDYYFEQVDKAEKDAKDVTIPDDAVIGKQFTGIAMVDPNTETVAGELEVEVGSFTEVDTSLKTYEYAPLGKKTFDTNWKKNTTESNDPFKLTVTCKNLVLVYKKSKMSEFGEAEAILDGEVLDETIQSYDPEGWNNPWTVVLLDEEKAAEHTLEIRMTEEEADKKFTILAVGYTQ